MDKLKQRNLRNIREKKLANEKKTKFWRVAREIMKAKRKEAPSRRKLPTKEDEEDEDTAKALRGDKDKAVDGGADSDENEDDSEGEAHDIGEGDYLADRLGEDEGEGEEESDSEEENDDDEDDEEEQDCEEEESDSEEEEEDEEGNDVDSGEEQRGNLWDSDGDDEEHEGDEEQEEQEDTSGDITNSASKRVAKPSVREKPVLPRGEKEKIKKDAARHQHLQEGRIVPESDSEEDGPIMRNPVGNVPMEWYKDEKHIGYSLDGKKILRRHNKDSLDRHLAKSDDPESWRSVYDEVNDEELRLTDSEVKLLRHLRGGMYEPGIDPYEDYPMPYDDPLLKIHPAHNRPTPKSQFVPKRYEAKMVVRYVRMLRAGKLLRPPPPLPEEERYNFDVWERSDDVKHRGAVPIPAPKPKLPGHAESYNPPPEYLLSKEEEEAMLKQV
jgi:ribosome biogenesis protein ERB1